jgi:hypothetical protein
VSTKYYDPLDYADEWMKATEARRLNAGYTPGYTNSTGQWQPSTINGTNPFGGHSHGLPGVSYIPASSSVPDAHFGLSYTNNVNDYSSKPSPTKETLKRVEQKFIVGNGSTNSFTFPTTEDFPAVAVYSRVVEGEGSEETTTVTELGSGQVTVSVTQGEQITVEFAEAPARRGAVILIG